MNELSGQPLQKEKRQRPKTAPRTRSSNINKDLTVNRHHGGYSIGDYTADGKVDDNVREEIDDLTKKLSDKKIQKYISDEMQRNKFLSVNDYRKMTSQVL